MATKGTDDFVLVAAIDFGTTFSGYAFSFKATKDDPDLPEKMRTNKSWGAALGFQSYKTPTSVLTTRSGKFLAFGFEAEQKYGEALEEEEDASPDMLLFRHFKMILHNKANVKLSATVASVDGTIKPAIDIFAHAIRYLKEHMLKAIQLEAGRKPDTSLIRWVITVPAIWSEESKQFMREAAFRAGCIKEKDSRKLVIALEPEAASLCCRRLKIAQYGEKTDVHFPTGTKYLVLDCGGGTIDITAHEMKFDKKVKELHRASGGPWGGTKVDSNFVELLDSVLGKNFLNAFRQKHPQEWLQFLTNFEKVKKSFKADGSSKITLSLQFSMASLFAQMNKGKSIDKALRESSAKGVTFGNGMLVIKHEAAQRLFAPVVDSVIQHTKQLLQDSRLRDIKYILMVGGFSECSVLQDTVKRNFQKNGIKVLIPNEAQMAIIKGAVLFGHKPEEIGSRMARYSFGCENLLKFDPSIHDERYKKEYDGIEKCDKLFCCFIEQDEEVQVGAKVERNFTPSTASTTALTFEVLCLDGKPKDPAQYTDVPEMKTLGNVRIELAGYGLDRNVVLLMTFGSTEIQVEAVDKATGNKQSAIVDFLHH